jgi:hypothetical protein
MADQYLPFSTQDQANEAGGLESGNPAMTYVDFANQMVKNSQSQQEQAEAIKQAQMLTQQRQAASAAGINPATKGYMSKDEAIALIQAELDRQKLLTPAVQADIDKWYAAAPQMVDQQNVKDFISKYQPHEEKPGAPFLASPEQAANPSMLTKEQDNLVAGEMYYDTGEKDAEGNAIYAHGGQEKVDKSGDKEAATAEKAWQKLDTEMNRFIRSSRGNSLTQAAQRAVRALNELGEGQPLTPQMLSYIQKDISGIFQGGVPPVAGQDSEDFTNVLQKVNGLIAKYTGVQGYLHHDLGNQRQYLLALLMRLRESTTDMLKQALASEASGYQTIIDSDPARWQAMIDGKMKAVEAGLSQNATTSLEGMASQPGGQNPPAFTPPTAVPAATPAGGPDMEAKKAALRAKLGIGQ